MNKFKAIFIISLICAFLMAGDVSAFPVSLYNGTSYSGSISGTVLDATTGAVLSGATVRIRDRAVVTEADGSYLLNGLQNGQYKVYISNAGYQTATQNVSIYGQGNSTLSVNLASINGEISYDIIVVGAGTGGFSAAVQASRLGMSVAILEETDWIGGQMTSAAVTSLDDAWPTLRNYGIYGEFADKVSAFYDAMGKSVGTAYNTSASIAFEPWAGQKMLYEMLDDTVNASSKGSPDLFLMTEVSQVIKSGNTVIGVVTTGGKTLKGKIVIDATEYGDLLPLAGAKYLIANSTGTSVNPDACLQTITYTSVIKNYPSGVPPELDLTTAPPGYSNEPFLFLNATAFNGTFKAWRGMPDSTNPTDYDAGSRSGLISKTGLNYFKIQDLSGNDFPITARYIEDKAYRKTMNCEAKLKTIRFAHYIHNELGKSGWSLSEDEGFDSNYNVSKNQCSEIPSGFKNIESLMPIMPYVRECRRVYGIMTLTAADAKRSNGWSAVNNFQTAIAVANYPYDLHGCYSDADLDFGEKGSLISENWTSNPPEQGWFQIPLEAFVPESVDGLLVAEKNISASRLVASSFRMQPSTMLSGQASGALAAVSVMNNLLPRFVNPIDVQLQLLDWKSPLSRCKFTDVPVTHPYWKYVQLADLYQVIDPVSVMNFGVDNYIYSAEMLQILKKVFNYNSSSAAQTFMTRGYMAKLVAKAIGFNGNNSYTSQTYSDVPSSHWAYPYVEFLNDKGIQLSCSTLALTFCPEVIATRGDAVAMAFMSMIASNATPAAYRGFISTHGVPKVTGQVVINGGAKTSNDPWVLLTLSASSTAGVVANMKFSKDLTTWYPWETFKTTRNATMFAGDGARYIHVIYKDSLGNESPIYTSSIIMDVTAPTGTITINENNAYASVLSATATLNADDGTGSGVAFMQFSNDNITWGGWETYNTVRNVTLLSGDGLKYVYVRFKDNAGNISPIYYDTITLDSSMPRGSIMINGGALFTNSTTATLTLTGADSSGNAASYMQFCKDGITWYGWEPYSTTRSSLILPSGDGVKTISVRFKDSGGKISPSYSASITLDTIAPRGSIAMNSGFAVTNSTSVTMNLSAANDEGGSGVTHMQFSSDGNSWYQWETFSDTRVILHTAQNGSYFTLYARFKDAAGNVSNPSSIAFLMDTSSPTGAIFINNGDAYTANASAILTLSANDGAGSGVAYMQLSYDNSAWYGWETYKTARNVTLLTGTGLKHVYVRFKDNAGNISPTYYDTITLDPTVTAPTGTISINNGDAYTTNASAVLTLSANNGAGSGIAYMQFSKDNATWYGWETYSSVRNVTLLSGDGLKYVYVIFKDNAGNVSPTYYDTITLDTSPPSGTISINNGATYTANASAMLALSASDGTGSGAAYMQFSYDNATWYGWETYSTVRNVPLLPGDGLKYIYVRFKDNAGNVSPTYYDAITLDTTAPTGAVSITGTAFNGSSYQSALSLTCDDGAGGGCANMQFSKDNVSWYAWETFSSTRTVSFTSSNGTKNIYVKFKDNAGNVSGAFSASVNIAPPSGNILFTNTASNWNLNSATVSLSCSGIGGCTQMQFSKDSIAWTPWESFSTTRNISLPNGAGIWMIYVKFKDSTGRISSSYSASANFGVTGTIAINGGAASTNTLAGTLTLSCQGLDGGACGSMRFSKDLTTWYSWETFKTTRGVSLIPAGAGTKTVYVQYKDSAGNLSVVFSDTIILVP